MALRGNLRDFSLPDVFQLVTFSKKTGVLRIRRADGVEGSVWFRDGDVFFAQSNWHREPLGERMVKAQRLTQNALSRALEIRTSEGKGGRRLGKILIDEGYVSETVLEAFVQEQIQDTIFDLMRWDEGDFDFEELPEVIEEDIGLAVSMENVVMEGARRLEEWTRIKKKVPSMDIVFKMATAPGEGTFEISLKPIEWQLLLLVDGTRSVAELAVETGRTDFEVARIIYGLFSAGLLEIAADDEVARLREERGVRQERLAAIRRETDLTVKAKAKRPSADEATAEPAVPHEEPSFLSAGAQEASADDMAVFEQMMGAVLEAPAAQKTEAAPETPEAEAEPAPEPEPDMGAFMDVPEAPAEVTSAFPMVGGAESLEAETPAEELPEAPEPEAEPLEPFVPAEADATAELMDLLAATGGEAPAIEETAAEAVASGTEVPELTGDLERDLMALGLGELPGEEAAEPPAEESLEAPSEEPSLADLEAAMSAGYEEAPAETPEGLPAHEAWAAAPGETAPEIEFTIPADVPDAEAQTEAEIEPEEAIEEVAEEPGLLILEDEGAESDEEPDFTDLLSSLESAEEVAEVEAEGDELEIPEVPPTLIATPSLDDLGMEPSETTGVISTDAFLDEIGGDMDLGTGIGDELTALTGGGGGGRTRPQASVKRIPDADSEALHMDQMVDKDLVMKIIDGIKKL